MDWMRNLKTVFVNNGAEMAMLRRSGIVEAHLYQITKENRDRLMWVEYPNGMRRINIRTGKEF